MERPWYDGPSSNKAEASSVLQFFEANFISILEFISLLPLQTAFLHNGDPKILRSFSCSFTSLCEVGYTENIWLAQAQPELRVYDWVKHSQRPSIVKLGFDPGSTSSLSHILNTMPHQLSVTKKQPVGQENAETHRMHALFYKEISHAIHPG